MNGATLHGTIRVHGIELKEQIRKLNLKPSP